MVSTVAVAAAGLDEVGGVQTVSRFLFEAINRSADLRATYVSFATSAADAASTRLSVPASWFKRPTYVTRELDGHIYRHYGCVAPELEFMRYRNTRALTEYLSTFDLVQVVAGSPAWAHKLRGCSAVVALQVATMVVDERQALLRTGRRDVKRSWRQMMTQVTNVLDRRGFAIPDVVFVENQNMESLAAQHGARMVRLAVPGVDTEAWTPCNDGKWGSGYLLAAGRLSDPRKDLSLAIRVVARLKERGLQVRLKLASSQPPPARVFAEAQSLGVDHLLEVHSSPDNADLAALYAGATAFLLTSAEEGLGMVVMEALASGCPVVATALEGTKMLIEDGVNGFLVERTDNTAQEMAARVQLLLNDEGRRSAMAAAARDSVLNNWSAAKAADRFVSVYREQLKCRRGFPS